MPFIGQQPITGAYSKLDSITTSATATYNLQLNGGAYYPQSANHLLVSLNGVMQAPQDSFTVSGSQITFASALTSSDSIDFIMALGDVLDIGTPSDGSVNTSQLANDAVTTAKIGASQITDAKIATGITASKLSGDINYSNLPVGSVIQTITNTSTTTVSTTGGQVNLISASITPKFANSVIHVEGYISRFDIIYGSSNAYGSVYLNNPSASAITLGVAGNSVSNNANPVSLFGTHSPNSTSSQTYTMLIAVSSGGTASVSTDGQRYTIKLVEIAQ